MKTCGVYGIRKVATNKFYVGGSVDIKRRWATHKKELTSKVHAGTKLLRAWNKYGADSWEWVVLEECSAALLLQREQYWIDKLDAYKTGYNSLPFAGQGTRGRKQSVEEIARRVATRHARGNYAHTEATKRLLGDIQRGVSKGPMSDAQKKLLSTIQKERGMPESERIRISKMARERVYTDEIRQNISDAHKGYVMPDEQKKKIGDANRGRPKPLEAMAKTLRSHQNRGVYFSPKTCVKYGLPVVLPQCSICAKCFVPKSSGAKTCGGICLIEASRAAARRRWDNQP
jgi:group I intron endonuclease